MTAARPIGPQMELALQFITEHPGCTKREALEAAGVFCRPYGGNPDSVDRLFTRGLIKNRGRRNRFALYPSELAEIEADLRAAAQELETIRQQAGRAGYWRPTGHP